MRTNKRSMPKGLSNGFVSSRLKRNRQGKRAGSAMIKFMSMALLGALPVLFSANKDADILDPQAVLPGVNLSPFGFSMTNIPFKLPPAKILCLQMHNDKPPPMPASGQEGCLPNRSGLARTQEPERCGRGGGPMDAAES